MENPCLCHDGGEYEKLDGEGAPKYSVEHLTELCLTKPKTAQKMLRQRISSPVPDVKRSGFLVALTKHATSFTTGKTQQEFDLPQWITLGHSLQAAPPIRSETEDDIIVALTWALFNGHTQEVTQYVLKYFPEGLPVSEASFGFVAIGNAKKYIVPVEYGAVANWKAYGYTVGIQKKLAMKHFTKNFANRDFVNATARGMGECGLVEKFLVFRQHVDMPVFDSSACKHFIRGLFFTKNAEKPHFLRSISRFLPFVAIEDIFMLAVSSADVELCYKLMESFALTMAMFTRATNLLNKMVEQGSDDCQQLPGFLDPCDEDSGLPQVSSSRFFPLFRFLHGTLKLRLSKKQIDCAKTLFQGKNGDAFSYINALEDT